MMSRLVILLASLGIAFVSPEHARADLDPNSFSVLRLMDFSFVLTADESVEIGPPVVFPEFLAFGDAGGDFSEAGVQADFPLGENFGPFNPFSQDGTFNFRIFGGVSAFADAPPDSFALLIQEVTAFFTFRNYGTEPAVINLFYHGTYSLHAEGNTSSAGIDLEAQLTPAGGDPVDSTLISDFLSNDASRDVRVPPMGDGVLPILLAGATLVDGVMVPGASDLRLQLTTRAEATARTVPEPSTLGLLCAGGLGLLVSASLPRRGSPS